METFIHTQKIEDEFQYQKGTPKHLFFEANILQSQQNLTRIL